MTDTALQNAIRRRDEMAKKIAVAEEQIAEWRAHRQRAERFISDWEEFSGHKLPVADDPTSVPSELEPPRKPQNPKKEDVARAACDILRENGEPMTRDELFDALTARGIHIHGTNPPVVLQTMLWRMKDQIIHLKGFGYWPREDDYMAADYQVGGDEPAEDAADGMNEDDDDDDDSVL